MDARWYSGAVIFQLNWAPPRCRTHGSASQYPPAAFSRKLWMFTPTTALPRFLGLPLDIDASVCKVAELGGKSDDVQTVPDVGRIAHCADDRGTPFSLYEPQA